MVEEARQGLNGSRMHLNANLTRSMYLRRMHRYILRVLECISEELVCVFGFELGHERTPTPLSPAHPHSPFSGSPPPPLALTHPPRLGIWPRDSGRGIDRGNRCSASVVGYGEQTTNETIEISSKSENGTHDMIEAIIIICREMFSKRC